MAKDDDDKPINGLDKLVNAIERGSAKSKALRELEERASASADVASLFKKDPNATPELIKKVQEKAALDQYRLIEEQRSRLASSQGQIAKTISHQFSEREFARQVHVNMREGDVPTSQYTGSTFAQLKREQYQTNIASQKTILSARAGVDPGKFYGIDPNTGETSLVGAGDPYRAVLQEQASQARSGASVALAIQNRRQEGSDPNSMLHTGGRLLARERNRLEDTGIREDVKSGKFDAAEETKKLSESGNKLAETMRKLSDAFEKFDASSDASVETLSKAEKEFEQVTKEYEKQSKIVKEIKSQGGIGGQGVSSAIGVATATLDVAKYQFISSNIQQNNLRAGIASATNEQFFDQVGAAKGDAGALRRMSTGFHDYANRQAMNYADISGQIAMGMASGGMIDATSGTVGVQQLLKGAATGNEFAVKAGGAIKGVTYAQKGLYGEDAMAARASIRALDTATNEVGDASMQKFIDFNMGMGRNLIGAGSRGGYDSVNRQTGALAGYGISPDQAASLFGQGSAQIGSNFLRNPGMLSAAGKAQSVGIMSAESYLGNVGTLTQAGGGQKDMEAVLANAVARGMDNAKSISAMVGSITSLSSSMAGEGVSNIAGNSQMFMSRLDALQGRGMTDEMAQAMAAKGTANIGALTSDTGLNIFTMQEQSGYSAGLPNVSLAGRTNVQSVDLATLKSLRAKIAKGGAEAEQARTEATQLGIGEFGDKELQTAIDIKVKTTASRMSYGGGISKDRSEALLSGRISDRDLTAEETAAVRMNTNTGAISLSDVNKAPTKSQATGPGGTSQEAIDVTKAGAQADFKMFQSVKDLGMTVGQLSTAMNTLAKTLDPNKAQAQSIKSASEMQLDKESLGDFKTGAKDLKVAASELRDAIKPMLGLVDKIKDFKMPSTIGQTVPVGGAFGKQGK
jgi:uncharacterized protein YoxC